MGLQIWKCALSMENQLTPWGLASIGMLSLSKIWANVCLENKGVSFFIFSLTSACLKQNIDYVELIAIQLQEG